VADLRRSRTLPRRLHLDTGNLQTLFDYGEQVWENEAFVAMERDGNVTSLADEVQAMRPIMAVNERAGFEFVVTNASLHEVDARGVQITRDGLVMFSTPGWCSPRETSLLARTPRSPAV
jgi:hypothetical protein